MHLGNFGHSSTVTFAKSTKESQRNIRSHFLPIADGIRVDDQEKLRIVADHINSECHQQAALAKQKHELWKSRSEEHVWRKYLNSQDDQLIQDLIKLAIDVYNDSLIGTLPAFNWASRSLAHKRADDIIAIVKKDGR